MAPTRTRKFEIEIGSEAKGVGAGFDKADKELSAFEKKMKASGDKAGKGLGDGIEAGAKGVVPKLKSVGEKAGKALETGVAKGTAGIGATLEQAGSTASDALSSGFDIGSIADSLTGAISGLGSTLGPVGAVAGLAIGGALTVGFLEGLEVERAGDKVAAQLDLTAAESERLGGVAGALYADAYGDSIEHVNEALGAVVSSLGDIGTFTDKELTKAGAMALDFAAIWDVDVTDAVGRVGILVNNKLVKDFEEGFDLMTAGMQQMPAAFRDELIPAVEEYSGFLAGLGFTGEEMFALMTRSAQDFGTFGIDKSMDALKEFGLRATDTSTATADAFETIGLDIEKLQPKLLAGGAAGREAFGEIVDGLLAIEDPVAQADAAIALFGSPLEDLSVQQIPEFLTNLANLEGGMGDVAGAASDAGDTLNDNLATRIESMKRTVLTKLVGFIDTKLIPAFRAVSDWARENPGLFQAVAVAVGLVAVAFTALAIAAGLATLSLLPITLPMFLISLAIVGLIAGIAMLVIHWDTLADAAGAAWNFIWEKASGVFNWVKTNWPLLLAILTGPIGLAVLAIVRNWDTIKAGITAVRDWIGDRINDIVSAVAGLGMRIGRAASGMWEGLKGTLATVVNWVLGKIETMINGLIRAYNSIPVLPNIDQVSLPRVSTGTPSSAPTRQFGGGGVTRMAEGGIVRHSPGGILANIGEGRHDEAVIPLDGRHGTGGDTYINLTFNVDQVNGVDDLYETVNKGIANGRIHDRGRRLTA